METTVIDLLYLERKKPNDLFNTAIVITSTILALFKSSHVVIASKRFSAFNTILSQHLRSVKRCQKLNTQTRE